MIRSVLPTLAMASLVALAALLDALFAALHVRFSSAVFGLLVLLALLAVRRGVDTPVARAAHGLLRWFPFFFVPACVGVMTYAGVLREAWAGITVALVGSTLLGIAVAATVGRAVRGWTTR